MTVIELSARYGLTGDDCATLVLSGDLSLVLDDQAKDDRVAGVLLTVLHECFSGEAALHERTISEDDLAGAFELKLDVIAGESLTFIARRYGRVIGSLVNEIETSEESRVLLHPKGGFNMIVYQERYPRETPGHFHQEAAAILAKL